MLVFRALVLSLFFLTASAHEFGATLFKIRQDRINFAHLLHLAMVEDSAEDPFALLDAVKGVSAPQCDEGYLSTHHVRVNAREPQSVACVGGRATGHV